MSKTIKTAKPVSEEKTVLRRKAMAVRARAHQEGGIAAAAQLSARALPFLLEISVAGSIVAGYWPIHTELDPRPLLEALGQNGRLIALPVVTGPVEPLVFRAWAPGDATILGSFGTITPGPSAKILVPDIVLVPLVGFDSSRHRLGYGRGYYDRTLQGLRHLKRVQAFGIAFAAQEMDQLPVDPWDQPLDRILTEQGIC